ncbi:hypothetical protein EW145_g3626 [Phellinidium pouzarii]|uniref:Uncharacterized protein n=1 Tax=Phellinidium pouzarii TaxID=167371 RepID=A0A4S4L6Y0_9AGAM|nr:hypothetical protein EW145_g3626 [Phellinidium pouzarii]
MTARPSLATKSKRPLSAIFLGSPSQVPDLPDPPSSPGSSGLPSPPATNSTGSDSNGGDNNTSFGSVRAPASLVMRNGSSTPRSASRSSSDDGDEGNGNDEDNTARLSDGRRIASIKEDQSALQRVKSLTQRNRLVLNKLASISSGSRLSTPSPPAVKRLLRSPAPSSSNSAGSSSRLSNGSSRKRSQSYSRASGSETEREQLNNATSSSEDLSETPTSTTTSSHFRSASVKERRTSAPIAPSKEVVHLSSRELSPGPGEPYTTGKRVLRSERPESRASVLQIRGEGNLYLVNSGAGDRVRVTIRFRSPLRHPAKIALLLDFIPIADLHPRALSLCMIHLSLHEPERSATQLMNATRMGDRREGAGGSGESPLLAGGRSVIGESLRAAGLARRREEGDDLFADAEAGRRSRLSSEVGARPLGNRAEARSGSRLSERLTTADRSPLEPRTPANPTHAFTQRNVQSVQAERPSTSMAAYREEPRTAPPLLRTYKSAYQIPETDWHARTAEEPTRPPSEARNVYPISSVASSERNASTLGRRFTATPLNLASAASAASPDAAPEHTRLMLDSLGMFESQLSRLPSMGSTTTLTIPELFRSAQNIVHATNALNGLLRSGTAHALEEQIDAELGEDGRAIDLVGLWRDVGAEYRESVRVSDELVRTMTSFLLGVGKVLRETMADKPHNRTISLDETTTRRATPDLFGGGRTSEGKLSSDGGSSRLDGNRRWEGSSGEMGKTTTSFTSLESSSASLQSSLRPSIRSKARAEVEEGIKVPEPLSEITAASRKQVRLSLVAPRRLESLQDLRDSQVRESAPTMQTSYSGDSRPPVDSSLTSISATHQQGTLPRRANTLATPPPLPTLLSESLLSRRASTKAPSVNRRPKISSTSTATVRATNSIFPAIVSSGEPTTAVNTTQASPERPSVAGARAAGTAHRTFSRSSGAALAGLQQQMEMDGRKRTISANSTLESDAPQIRSGSDGDERADSRTRTSLDSSNSRTFTTRTGRDRRGTVTGLFTRT